MTYQKKYTDNMIFEIIDEHDNIISPRQVIEGLGCAKMTADSLLKTMAMSGKIKQVNVGTEDRAVWIYSRKER